MYRHSVPVETGPWYRTDTASGSNSAVTVFQNDGVTAIRNAFAGTGSTVKVNTRRGNAEFLSSSQTLYLKRLTYKGAVAGDTPITSTGADLTLPAPADPSTTYAIQPGSGVTGKDVQFPTARTKQITGISAHVLQNNDSAAPDSGTRVYIVPRGTPTAGVGAVIKLFADDYSANQTDYRDFGIYYSKDQNSDTGTRSSGVFWFNGKVNGTYTGTSPDIGFSMQDGQYVAGRVALATVNGSTPNIQWVFGPSVPRIGTKVAVAAEVQGDLGFGTAGDSAIRWQRTDASTTDNAFSFQRASGGGNVKVTLGSTQRLLLNNAGSLVLGNGSSALSTASTDGFLYFNSMAGTPTGTPTTQGAAVPVVLDTTGSKLWAYFGGGWKSVALA